MKSTSEIHKNPVDEYVGPYINIRKTVSKLFSLNYTRDRQFFQDSIILSYFKNIKKYLKPKIIYTCGCFGAGKSHSLNYLSIVDFSEFIFIDPDKIKYQLPEMSDYIKHDPNNAGNLVHVESIYIALIIEIHALEQKYNIIVDGSLQNSKWYTTHIADIRKSYPDYTILIIKVDAQLNTIKQRCKIRGEKTKRIISDDLLDNIYTKIPASFEILKDLVDMYYIIDNNDIHPIITKIKINNF
jgi:hypothetical protein